MPTIAKTPVRFSERTYLDSKTVAKKLGYANPDDAFWQFVRNQRVPHIPINQRKIIFDEALLEQWIDSRLVS
jgi:predicted DNA-binding transcriptional regulator AlpA